MFIESEKKRCSSKGPRGIQCESEEGHDGFHKSLFFSWEGDNSVLQTSPWSGYDSIKELKDGS